jgi:hypothetical protein
VLEIDTKFPLEAIRDAWARADWNRFAAQLILLSVFDGFPFGAPRSTKDGFTPTVVRHWKVTVLDVRPRKVAFMDTIPYVETDKMFFPATFAPHVLLTIWYTVLESDVMDIVVESSYAADAVMPEKEDEEYPADMRLSPDGDRMTTLLQHKVIEDAVGRGKWRFREIIEKYGEVPLMVRFSHGM